MSYRFDDKSCARTKCNRPANEENYNTSTRHYYCDGCKKRILEWPENAGIFDKSQDPNTEFNKITEALTELLGQGWQDDL